MKYYLTFISTISISLLTFFLHTAPVLAALTTSISNQIEGGEAKNMFSTNIGTYLSKILQVALLISALACLFMIVSGGISWITSGGDKAKYEAARNRITAALVGLAITACAWTLWIIVIKFFGLNNSPNLIINENSSSQENSSTEKKK